MILCPPKQTSPLKMIVTRLINASPKLLPATLGVISVLAGTVLHAQDESPIPFDPPRLILTREGGTVDLPIPAPEGVAWAVVNPYASSPYNFLYLDDPLSGTGPGVCHLIVAPDMEFPDLRYGSSMRAQALEISVGGQPRLLKVTQLAITPENDGDLPRLEVPGEGLWRWLPLEHVRGYHPDALAVHSDWGNPRVYPQIVSQIFDGLGAFVKIEPNPEPRPRSFLMTIGRHLWEIEQAAGPFVNSTPLQPSLTISGLSPNQQGEWVVDFPIAGGTAEFFVAAADDQTAWEIRKCAVGTDSFPFQTAGLFEEWLEIEGGSERLGSGSITLRAQAWDDDTSKPRRCYLALGDQYIRVNQTNHHYRWVVDTERYEKGTDGLCRIPASGGSIPFEVQQLATGGGSWSAYTDLYEPVVLEGANAGQTGAGGSILIMPHRGYCAGHERTIRVNFREDGSDGNLLRIETMVFEQEYEQLPARDYPPIRFPVEGGEGEILVEAGVTVENLGFAGLEIVERLEEDSLDRVRFRVSPNARNYERTLLLRIASCLQQQIIVENGWRDWFWTEAAVDSETSGNWNLSWMLSDWFGNYQDKWAFPWVYHRQHWWIYCYQSNDRQTVYHWDHGLFRWTWTDPSIYPWMVIYGNHQDEQGTYRFETTTAYPNRIFYAENDPETPVAEAELSFWPQTGE